MLPSLGEDIISLNQILEKQSPSRMRRLGSPRLSHKECASVRPTHCIYYLIFSGIASCAFAVTSTQFWDTLPEIRTI